MVAQFIASQRSFMAFVNVPEAVNRETLTTLHHKVLAVSAFWEKPKVKPDMPTLRLAVTRQRRHWFEGLWANASGPVYLKSA